jgi:hypothetical protein
VDTNALAKDLEVPPLISRGVEEARKPRERDCNTPPVCKSDDELVFRDGDLLGPGINAG